jgi:RND family efflux transporter MFP subunit
MPAKLRRLWIPALGAGLLLALIGRTLWSAGATAQPPAATPGSSPAHGSDRVSADGRLVARPGADVTLGSDLDGTVVRVTVDERERVRRGQVLVELRADDHRAALAEARARIAEAEADIRLSAAELERARRLLGAAVGTPREVDRAERDLDAARARRGTAVAAAARLEAVVAKTRVVSPIDGVVLAREVHPGETIEAGRPLMRVAELARTRVEAEVDEFDAAAIAEGAAVTVSAEGYEERWPARVEEIPDAVTGRRLKPDDPGRPTDTRVLLVKIAFDEPTPLKLGQRVELEIAARRTPGRAAGR